ncbi:Cyclin-dependent kinase 1 [Astathelohania contejeani]|uniref:Cyclin-dependent kinase 1 n=1 Tax=Astathelohania contejeani TaxID=164912 RepID=A0ABQ7I1N7_9MICR|nr:Cyclin-dependent kinase 1 [Thelohania contejeani]
MKIFYFLTLIITSRLFQRLILLKKSIKYNNIESSNQYRDKLYKKVISGYQFHEILGEGVNGTVYSAIEKENRKLVAIKKIKRKNMTNEHNFLRMMNHPNILQMKTCFYKGKSLFLVFEQYNCIISEANNIKLCNLIKSLILAYMYLHGLGIAHGDWNERNIMVDMEGSVRVCDFSSSYYISKNFSKAEPLDSEPLINDLELEEDKKTDIVDCDHEYFIAFIKSIIKKSVDSLTMNKFYHSLCINPDVNNLLENINLLGDIKYKST